MKIPERQTELEDFYREHLEERPGPATVSGPKPATAEGLPTDEAVIEKLLHETSGKGKALFAGDVSGYESESNRDQAFMNKLYFYTQDEGQIDAIWRRSGCYRKKWDRHDYRRRTYMKAANTIASLYEWETTKPPNSPNLTNRPNPPNPLTRV